MKKCRGFRVLLIGAPGSGKGHVCEQIVKTFGAVHISPGNILRTHILKNTLLGKKTRKLTSSGQLVPDHLLAGVMSTAINKAKTFNFVLDGYPRNLAQAKYLDRLIKLDMVIHLDLPVKAIMHMLKHRLVHLPSGRVYNEGASAPLVPGKDDVTGESLVRRPDDSPNVILTRLSNSNRNTMQVIWHYKQRNLVHTIKASKHKKIWPQLESYLKMRWKNLNLGIFKPDENVKLMD